MGDNNCCTACKEVKPTTGVGDTRKCQFCDKPAKVKFVKNGEKLTVYYCSQYADYHTHDFYRCIGVWTDLATGQEVRR